MSPAWLECRTTCQHGQKRGCWRLIEHQVQQFEGRRIRPVQVFQDKEDRLTFSKFQEDGDDGFECLLALSLWGHMEQRITVFGKRKGKYWREQRHRVFAGKSVLAQCMFEFAEFLVRGIPRFKLP